MAPLGTIHLTPFMVDSARMDAPVVERNVWLTLSDDTNKQLICKYPCTNKGNSPANLKEEMCEK